MRRTIIAIVIGVAAVHAACIDFNTDYYVSVDGNDSGCFGECPVNKPCTVGRALLAAQYDDLDNVIHVLPGIYGFGGLEYNITETHSLTIRSESGNAEDTIFDAGVTGTILTVREKSGVDSSGVTIAVKNLKLMSGIPYALDFSRIGRANAELEGNVFEGNGYENSSGGAAYISTVDGNVTVAKNIFRNNSAYAGGALFIQTNAATKVLYNEFYRNTAYNTSELVKENGGAVFALTDTGHFVIANNVFIENYALDKGGAVYGGVRENGGILAITNNTFVSNRADENGTGIDVGTFNDGANVSIENNILKNNNGNGTEIALENSSSGTGSDIHMDENYYSLFSAAVPANITEFGHISGTMNLQEVRLTDGRRSLRRIAGFAGKYAGNRCADGFQPYDYEGAYAPDAHYIGAVVKVAYPMLPAIDMLLLY